MEGQLIYQWYCQHVDNDGQRVPALHELRRGQAFPVDAIITKEMIEAAKRQACEQYRVMAETDDAWHRRLGI